MARNNEYWRQRFRQLEEARHKDVQSLLPDIDRIYKEAQAELEQKVRAWYQRLADNNDVSMAEARKILSKNELKEFKWTVEEYIKRGKENARDQRWMKELENASAKFHINRLEALKLQVQQSLEVVYGNQLDQLDTSMRELYQEGYYRTAFELQKGFRIGFPVAAVDQNKLDKIIKKPWAPDGKNFSDRIWQNKARLISEVHTELTRMCITGAAPDAAIRNIAKKMNTSRHNAGRLVMTEAAYFGSVSQKDCFNDLNVEQYEICATLDSHTSELCQSLDGKVFDMKDYEAGVTAPPFHVFCRTCTVPYFDDEFTAGEMRAARGADGKTYYVPADMKYPEWKEQFAGKHTVAATSRKENTRVNRHELGIIDKDRKEEALSYFGNLIKEEAKENLIVIEQDGTAVRFVGDSNSVQFDDVKLKGAYLVHNHPKSEGIVSFGEDDFNFLKENQDIALFVVTNEIYRYSVKVLKDISGLSYNEIYRNGLNFINTNDFEMQHGAFLYLREKGYVWYERKKID